MFIKNYKKDGLIIMEKKHGHQYKDITGQRFGNMVVLEDSGIRQNRKVVWTCQCDCGEIFNTRADRINSGSVKSCPKCVYQLRPQAKNIKPGDKFLMLTVLERTDRKTNNRVYYWKCQCDCGNIVEVIASHLGKTQSCGCAQQKHYENQIIDITGQRFGMLTALKRTDKKGPNGSYLWTCQCDCGKIKDINGSSLRNQEVISCGCSKYSAGELKIRQILSDNNILFEAEKTFPTCKFLDSNLPARFDFYLPDYNLLIEYDGKQHFSYKENTNFWDNKENFEKTQMRDAYKTQWAKDNNIRLKRVPYYDYKRITLDYLLI